MIVVTGGAGFIGSNIVAALGERGARVVVCDRLGSQDKWRNLAKHAVFEIVTPEALLPYLEAHAPAVDAIVHMGAITATTERDVEYLLDNNFRFSLRLWRWCGERAVRFIYASSAATYGDGKEGFGDANESAALARLAPLNPYGWSKHLFDCHVIRALEDGTPQPPQWAGLKFFNVYGPNEYHKEDMRSVVAKIHPDARNGRAVRLFKSHRPDYDDGGQLRDFVWVGDCVDVVLWLLDNPSVSGLYNLGSGKARSFADLAGALFAALEMPARITYFDMPPEVRDHYQYFTEAEMSRLRAAGYERPFTSLDDGIARYVRDYLATPDPYR